MEASKVFWENVNRFRELGLDPLKWIAGCSVEVEREEVVYPAIEKAGTELQRLGVTILPQEGPDAVEFRGEPIHLDRIVVRPTGRPYARAEARRANPNRAALTTRVAQRKAASPESFGPALLAS